ncbi:MAG: asparagine--tRNA ligase [Chlamydiae bacterium]|nr:asparagine--tRNA ligase [Chlamydiota bacterium]
MVDIKLKRTKVSEIDSGLIGKHLFLQGWVRTCRSQKGVTFIELNDGSSIKNIQLISNQEHALLTGASIAVTGTLVKSPSPKQPFELQMESLDLIGDADSSFPLQKKGHTLDFLRDIAHLRPRTNTFGAVARVRSRMAFAVHEFFQKRKFFYVQTPVITSSDCEGAGELFELITETKNFFGKKAFLTCSGQLNGECFATALGDIYTFGPTFRAENSHTSRHLAEFWMIEPEMAFFDLKQNMELAESFVKHLVQTALEECSEDLGFFEERYEKGLKARLQIVLDRPFERISYTEAIDILLKSKIDFQYPVEWGKDLQSEHERYIAETVVGGPVILYNYPKTLKPFYMKANEDGKTVACMDVLVPKIGEIIGGSQREDNLLKLEEGIRSHGLNPSDYDWYLDLRRFGSVPHSGFGLGFERAVQFITGMENIRDIIAFPRAAGLCSF